MVAVCRGLYLAGARVAYLQREDWQAAHIDADPTVSHFVTGSDTFPNDIVLAEFLGCYAGGTT
jgi:hypothetical protein